MFYNWLSLQCLELCNNHLPLYVGFDKSIPYMLIYNYERMKICFVIM